VGAEGETWKNDWKSIIPSCRNENKRQGRREKTSSQRGEATPPSPKKGGRLNKKMKGLRLGESGKEGLLLIETDVVGKRNRRAGEQKGAGALLNLKGGSGGH